MKILVGNNLLGKLGGSETFTYTLVEELVRRGHHVECVTRRSGEVGERISRLGVPVHTSPVHGTFDVALLSHSSSISMTTGVKAFKVQTCHGIFPTLEQPVAGMNAYVAISEEVQDHLDRKGFSSIIIRNGVNCNRFRPVHPINNELKTILSLSQSASLNAFLARFCARLGYRVIVRDKHQNAVWEVEEELNAADLVISLGRGCFEAMATGRNVLVYDNRAYARRGAVGDGLVTLHNVRDFLRNNCSGRFLNKAFTEEELQVELEKYNKRHGEELREYAYVYLNIERQVDKYLALIR